MAGYIHSFESMGAVDGPGLRFVVFMQGCPMRCLYCHNPDTWQFGAGNKYTAEEVAETALRYKNYIKNGGVTVSGGEPLMQIEFVTELFKILKSKGVHTALDTSGVTFNAADCGTVKKHAELLGYTDLVLLDIKHIDNAEHRKLTGFSNDNVLAFARFLDEKNKSVWLRHVLVPGITDKEETLLKLKEFADGLGCVEKIEVLPYHNLAEVKYDKMNLSYPLKGLEAPSEDSVRRAREILCKKHRF